jgi:hypothetical protein
MLPKPWISLGDHQVGNMKGVGRVYQQTFLDTRQLYDRTTPITAADLLIDRVLSFFEEQGVMLVRVLTDRGTEYCGNPERHEYELFAAYSIRWSNRDNETIPSSSSRWATTAPVPKDRYRERQTKSARPATASRKAKHPFPAFDDRRAGRAAHL